MKFSFYINEVHDLSKGKPFRLVFKNKFSHALGQDLNHHKALSHGFLKYINPLQRMLL